MIHKTVVPKKITRESVVNLVHTSSPIFKEEMRDFVNSMKKLHDLFPRVKEYDVMRSKLDPRYLAGSKNERLKQFKTAIKNVDWLFPVSGGTGCADVIRELTGDDHVYLKKNRPVTVGFSDATFLINYLYFKLNLLTFCFINADALLYPKNYELLLRVIHGEVHAFSFFEPSYQWLGGDKPTKPIHGIAVGGNLEVFRDLLDICKINPESWEPYILFIEDRDLDLEDYHRILIALDERGIFKHIRALVVGRIDDRGLAGEFKRLNAIFGKDKGYDHHKLTEYLLSDIIKERHDKKDPLYILKVENFGHGVSKNRMIVPVGGSTVIYPDKEIEFIGPFVE